jgi:hypothetical protein
MLVKISKPEVIWVKVSSEINWNSARPWPSLQFDPRCSVRSETSGKRFVILPCILWSGIASGWHALTRWEIRILSWLEDRQKLTLSLQLDPRCSVRLETWCKRLVMFCSIRVGRVGLSAF